MDLTAQEQLIVEGGLAAQALLDNPTFTNVIGSLTHDCFEAFTTTTPSDTQGRENAYFQYRGLQAIEAEINARILQKDEIARKLDANHEDADND